ncbi:MAG: c-type cytochrome [Cytophagales bacterium]|nr:c-type cytochrome [Cytophagales bacterium]
MKKILISIPIILVLGIICLLCYVKFALPNVGAAPDITIKSTPEVIARGKYLAHSVCVCIDCHSTRDWSKFAAPLIENTYGKGGELFDEKFGFPGKFTSKNITPFGVLSWTDGELYRAITCGVSKDGHALFPIMPYKYYAGLDPEDVKAVIAYIRTLQPIEYTPEASVPAFPMNFIINTIPQKNTQNAVLPSKDDTLAYGKYMTNAAGCMECHTKQDKGQQLKGMEYAGGFEFALLNGTVRSANITPHQTGIANLSKSQFINRFKSYADSSYKPTDVGKGFQTVMPWMMYAQMDTTDLGAIYTYLRTVPPVENKVVKFTAYKGM